jgi:hypothetical protein
VRKAHAVLLAALALTAGGCGGDDPGDVLSETASNLADVKSGDLDLQMLISAQGVADADLGFELAGPFSLAEPGSLPTTAVDYTQIAGAERAEVRLIATGEEAWVELDGTAYELPPDEAEGLRRQGRELKSDGGLGDLKVEEWVKDPKLSDGEDGADRIEGDLDVSRALPDLLQLSGGLAAEGAKLPEIGDQQAEELERAVEEARLVVETGEDDRLLRRLTIDISFKLDTPADAGELGSLEGATITFDLALDKVNEPVEVQPPADPQPASALPSGG